MKAINKFLLAACVVIGCFIFVNRFFLDTSQPSQFVNRTVENSFQKRTESGKNAIQQSIAQKTVTVKRSGRALDNERNVDISVYESMTYQEILEHLAVSSSRADIDISAILLALIENGKLEVNSPMREGPQSSYYTPLYAALVLDDYITTEQVQSFIKLGAYIEASSMWTRQLAKLQDSNATELLIDAAGYGPEQTGELLQAAFQQANVELFNRLLEKGDFIMDSSFSDRLFSQSMPAIEHEVDYFLSNQSVSGNTTVDLKLNALYQDRIKNRIAQLQLLKQNRQLSFERQKRLDSQLIVLEDLLVNGAYKRAVSDAE